MLERQLISALELAEDLGFAQHHRVQPARDPEQVLHALRLGEPVNFVGQRIAIIVASDKEFLQLRKGLARFKRGRRINFHSVAGGQNYRLVRCARIAQQLQRGGDARVGESESFPHGNGRGMMTEAEQDDGH